MRGLHKPARDGGCQVPLFFVSVLFFLPEFSSLLFVLNLFVCSLANIIKEDVNPFYNLLKECIANHLRVCECSVLRF